MPLFSVIIPVYNHPDYLREALESVYAQTLKDYELILVDDGSTDPGVSQLLQSCQGQMQVIKQANAGQAVARNRGVASAKGKYIAFLDADDVWYPHTLEVFKKVIDQAGQPSMISGKPQYWTEHETLPAAESTPLDYQLFSTLYATGMIEYFLGSGNLVVQREVFNRIGGFPKMRDNAEDLDLFMLLSTAPGYVQINAPYTLAYRMHEENSIKQIDSTARGVLRMLERQRKGIYPGGPEADQQRVTYILTACRNWSIKAAKQKQIKTSMQLYTATLKDHLKQMRVRYLLGLPLLCLWKLLSLTARPQ